MARQRIYLGDYDSLESHERYHRFVAEWLANGRRLPTPPGDATVVELIDAFRRHAEIHYRYPDGTRSYEYENYRRVLKILRKLYGRLPIEEFTPACFRACRAEMIGTGWTRKSINRSAARLRHVFRWGVSESLVPETIHRALGSIPGLQAGRSEAKEGALKNAVAIERVDAVLPFLTPVLADMVQVQLLTAMRPGELCSMRPRDIDRSGETWLYVPARHKNSHRGKDRAIAIGPRAQAILAKYLFGADDDSCLFTPRESELQRKRALSEARVTPLSCGNRPGTNRSKNPIRLPGAQWETRAYAAAIRAACDRAFPHPVLSTRKASKLTEPERLELEQWREACRWSPNQLRKAAATRVQQETDLETARAVLGHSNIGVTEQFYAQADRAKATAVMARIG